MERKTSRARVYAREEIYKGALIQLFFYDHRNNCYTEETALITLVEGYRVELMRSGTIEVWDIHDLETMARLKKEDETIRALRAISGYNKNINKKGDKNG